MGETVAEYMNQQWQRTAEHLCMMVKSSPAAASWFYHYAQTINDRNFKNFVLEHTRKYLDELNDQAQ